MRFIYFLLLASVVMLSCTKSKEEVFINDGIAGKWKLKEIFAGYVMGGNFQWNSVQPDARHVLEFHDNGTYEVGGSLSSAGYSGTYIRVNDSTILRTFSNQSDPSRFFNHKISLTPSELIIDYPNIEGVIRYKYVATAD